MFGIQELYIRLHYIALHFSASGRLLTKTPKTRAKSTALDPFGDLVGGWLETSFIETVKQAGREAGGSLDERRACIQE